eukprot:4584924-Pleurochrysis_carterae.AAC.1
MVSRSAAMALRRLSSGTKAIPRAACSRTPWQVIAVPSSCLSTIAIMSLIVAVSASQTWSARTARPTPSTPCVPSSVYMWKNQR